MENSKLQGLQTSIEKYWVELTADEKIERMRNEVKSLKNKLNATNNNLFKVKELFLKHKHLDGEVVNKSDMRSDYDEIASGALINKNQDQVYF